MPIYKVSFLGNHILSIREAEGSIHFDGRVYLEQDNGRLIFAIVKASDEDEARHFLTERMTSLSGDNSNQLSIFPDI